MVVVAALAYVVDGLQSATYSAQSTIVVTSAPGPVDTTATGAAGDLATTYAAALPHDQALKAYVARQAHVPATGAISALPGRGAVVRLTFTAASPARALAAGRAIARALSAPTPASSVVSPGSLKLVQSPTQATATLTGSYRAQVVMIVPSSGGPSEGINPDDADHLATTYAGVISTDDALLADVGKATGESASHVSENLAVVNQQNTSILQISFKARDPQRATVGARTVARLLAGSHPVASGIVPSSIEIVSLPQRPGAPAAKHDHKALVVGAALGLLLGLVLLVAWERSDPRIRGPRELSMQIGCPATPLDRLSPNAAYALLERWASLTDHVPARVAVLPANASVESDAAAAVDLLRHSGAELVHYVDARSGSLPEIGAGDEIESTTGVVLVEASPPGGERAGEAVALGCDLTVVAVPDGARAADMRQLVEELTNFGIVPVWALLTRGGRHAAKRQREFADAVSS
jgi:capsular polysaccharide biosynthesis protein